MLWIEKTKRILLSLRSFQIICKLKDQALKLFLLFLTLIFSANVFYYMYTSVSAEPVASAFDEEGSSVLLFEAPSSSSISFNSCCMSFRASLTLEYSL